MGKAMNPLKEVTVFSIVFGLLAGFGACAALTGLKNSPDLWGVRRSIAIGIPLLIIALLFLLSGTALLLTKKKWAVTCAIGSAFATAALYFAFEVSTIGFFQAKLVSLIAYALPVLLIVRGAKAISYIAEQSSRRGD